VRRAQAHDFDTHVARLPALLAASSVPSVSSQQSAISSQQSAASSRQLSALIPQPSAVSPHSAAASALVEPLTEREREVLELIAAGLSNQEIADHLILSVGTVKWYAGQIYGKLAVQSRSQAIARAHALQLLTQSPYRNTGS
jgi:ATP/maltotriose-dependent transcriptional regulator MalT